MKIGINTIRLNVANFLFENSKCSVMPILFFRISIGLFLMCHYVAIMEDVERLFGPKNSIFPDEIANLFIDNYVITLQKIYSFSGLTIAQFHFFFSSLYILFALLITFGFYTRISALLMLLLNTALIKSNVFLSYGVDYFTSMSLFYLILFPEIPMYSLKAFLKIKKPEENYIIFRRFIQIHLCFAYFYSGLNKILGYNWRNGEAVWKAINLPYSNVDFNINISWLKNFPILLILSCWFVIVVELCYPLILLPKIRKKWFIATILMHLGIALILNLYFFSTMMILWNITAFYDFDDEIEEKPLNLIKVLKKKLFL